jgi:hypothetical protein
MVCGDIYIDHGKLDQMVIHRFERGLVRSEGEAEKSE